MRWWDSGDFILEFADPVGRFRVSGKRASASKPRANLVLTERGSDLQSFLQQQVRATGDQYNWLRRYAERVCTGHLPRRMPAATCAIWCAITTANSTSVSANTIRPLFTYQCPPGNAKCIDLVGSNFLNIVNGPRASEFRTTFCPIRFAYPLTMASPMSSEFRARLA